MNTIPDDCIYEIMRQLGPALIRFRAVSKHFWALYNKYRAILESTTLTYHKLITGPSCTNLGQYRYIKVRNNLLPNKVLHIMEYHFGRSHRYICKKVDSIDDIEKIKLTIKNGYMLSFDDPGLEPDDEFNIDVKLITYACFGTENTSRGVEWIKNGEGVLMSQFKPEKGEHDTNHILSKFTVKYFIKGTILEEIIAKDILTRSSPKTNKEIAAQRRDIARMARNMPK